MTTDDPLWMAQRDTAAAALNDASGHRPWVDDFGDPAAEEKAVEESAVMFDTSDRAHITLTGADCMKFMHNFCTNDVQGLAAGKGCEAFVTNVKGRVLGFVQLARTSDALRLGSSPGTEAQLLAHLDRYLITEDVTLTSEGERLGELFFCGPAAHAALRDEGLDSPLPEPYDHASLRDSLFVQRSDRFGRPGFTVAGPPAELADLWRRCLDGGVWPGGHTAYDALRIRAAWPLHGIDCTDANLAQEVNRTTTAISFRKGCYLGQEPIARLDAMGHVNRELCSIEIDGGEPLVGDAVVSPSDARELGALTSVGFSHRTGKTVALAVIRTSHSQPGAELAVTHADQTLAAKVCSRLS